MCLLIGELAGFRNGPALFLVCSFPQNHFKQREMISLQFVKTLFLRYVEDNLVSSAKSVDVFADVCKSDCQLRIM